MDTATLSTFARGRFAGEYLWLWNELKKNTPKSADVDILVGKTPLPADPARKTNHSIFSPRDSLKALDWYAEQAKAR